VSKKGSKSEAESEQRVSKITHQERANVDEVVIPAHLGVGAQRRHRWSAPGLRVADVLEVAKSSQAIRQRISANHKHTGGLLASSLRPRDLAPGWVIERAIGHWRRAGFVRDVLPRVREVRAVVEGPEPARRRDGELLAEPRAGALGRRNSRQLSFLSFLLVTRRSASAGLSSSALSFNRVGENS
jgi:hypothetical protein